MNKEILERAISSINLFCHEFRDNPYSYLLESDIQCALFARLRNDINRFVDVVGINKESYHLNIVNSEYLDRFDICCLNTEKILRKLRNLKYRKTKVMMITYTNSPYSWQLN